MAHQFISCFFLERKIQFINAFYSRIFVINDTKIEVQSKIFNKLVQLKISYEFEGQRSSGVRPSVVPLGARGLESPSIRNYSNAI